MRARLIIAYRRRAVAGLCHSESVPEEPHSRLWLRSAVRPSGRRRIVQILLALQYVVRQRRMSTYMGGEADKKIEQLPASGGAGPVPSSRMERKTSGGLIL